ncbi:MAG: ABC transporter ATP-binding protein/permease [Candidatus Omnitrophica bacterium]|nr:ABC transporter ATP-binding protein/permease [Candidatus Omnitrophota bacterium]
MSGNLPGRLPDAVIYRRLFLFVRPHLRRLVFAIGMMLFSAAFDSASLTAVVPLGDKVLSQKQIVINRPLPPLLASLVARINAMPALRLLNILVAVLVVMFIAKGLLEFQRNYLVVDLSQRVVRDMRNALYEKIQGLSLDYFSESVSGHLVSRVTYDVEVLRGALSHNLTNVFYQIGQVLCLAAIALFINWRWALISLLLVPVVALPIHRIGKIIKKISGMGQQKMGELNRKLIETISGVRIVKAFSMEAQEVARFTQENFSFYKIMVRVQKRLLLLGPFVELIGACGAAFVLYYGGKEVIAERISLGVFILFLGSLISLVKPCRRLSEIHGTNQQALAAAQRIFDVLDWPVTVREQSQAVTLAPLARSIEFKRVHFRYQETEVLQGINLQVKKGQVVALVGSSGAGKTTLVNLLPRFYDPNEGQVFFDGTDIRTATLSSLRRQIGIVTQDLFLFHDTVRNNIAYGWPDAPEQAVIQAATIARADEFIRALPQGYQTMIGDMGMKLSGGQKQRLAIARAILHNPPVLILDEATSQLDAESAKLVQEALDRIFIDRTVFVIAHRLTTVKKADRILVLERGRIVEEGTHEALLKENGLYNKLYCMEFLPDAL